MVAVVLISRLIVWFCQNKFLKRWIYKRGLFICHNRLAGSASLEIEPTSSPGRVSVAFEVGWGCKRNVSVLLNWESCAQLKCSPLKNSKFSEKGLSVRENWRMSFANWLIRRTSYDITLLSLLVCVDLTPLLKFINKWWRETKGNHYREGGWDICS